MTSSHIANVHLLDDADHALAMRAELRLTDGDMEGAWQDAEALHRLAGLYCQQFFAVPFGVGIAADLLASQVDSQIAVRPDLPADRARGVLRDLQILPDLPSAEQALTLGERGSQLDAVMQIMATRTTLSDGTIVPLHRRGIYDFNWVLRRVNARMNEELVPLHAADYAERKRLLEQYRLAVRKETERSGAQGVTGVLWNVLRYYAYPPSARPQLRTETIYGRLAMFLVPSLGGCDDHRLKAAMHRQLNHVAFALSAWHAEKGGYPKALAELVPDCRPGLPADVFNGKPLVYRVSDSGYLLYSVGTNGRDDGGCSADDIVVRAGPPAVPATNATPAEQAALSY